MSARQESSPTTRGLEQRPVNLPSWGGVQNILRLAFHNDRARWKTMVKHWDVLRENYDAWYQRAQLTVGEEIPEEDNKMLKFTKKYLDPDSTSYSPHLIDRLGPMTSMIRDSFPQFRSKRPVKK